MARLITLTMTKTYASAANAQRAVEKLYPATVNDNLDYLILQHTDGRFYPVFLGERAVQAGVHFNFHVAG